MTRLRILREELEAAATPAARVQSLARYFEEAQPEDAAWTLFFALGGRLPRPLAAGTLRRWVCEASQLPDWMVQECLDHGRDSAETFALLLPERLPPPSPEGGDEASHLSLSFDPPAEAKEGSLASLVRDILEALPTTDGAAQKRLTWRTWERLGLRERVLWHELLQGRLRLGLARAQVVRAIAKSAELPASVVEERLHENWQPGPGSYEALLAPAPGVDRAHNPRSSPTLAPLDRPADSLGHPGDWWIAWAWDGLPAQLWRRGDDCSVWSADGECLTARFPEIALAGRALPPGSRIQGMLVALSATRPLPRAALQARLGARVPSDTARQGSPVAFLAFDLLECRGKDLRESPLAERHAQLEDTLRRCSQAPAPTPALPRPALPFQADLFDAHSPARRTTTPAPTLLRVLERLSVATWIDADRLRRQAREQGARGLELRPWSGSATRLPQGASGWLWLDEPLVARLVLVAARPPEDHPRGPLTQYTLAAWAGSRLVPVAQVDATLPPEEVAAVGEFIRRCRAGRHGPVRAVEPALVFEVAYQNVVASSRRRAGIVLGQPRLLRWLQGTPAGEAAQLEAIRAQAQEPEILANPDASSQPAPVPNQTLNRVPNP